MSDTFGVRVVRHTPWTALGAIVVACVVLGTTAGRGLAFQATASAGGHWTGTITGPEIAVEVDLASKGAGTWHGTISIPSQGTKGLPLSEVSVKGTAVTFAIPQAPGDPRFAGTLSADGKTIAGNFPAAQDGGFVGRAVAFVKRAPDRPFTRPSHSAHVTCRIATPSTTLRYEYAADLVFAAEEPAGRFGRAVSSGNWRSGSA